MAANTLVKPATYGENEIVPHQDLNALQLQAAQSVNRHNTKSGVVNYPLVPIGKSSTSVGSYVVATGLITLSAGLYTVGFALDRLPDGHMLTQLRMYLLPAGAHAGQPGTLPTLKLYKVSLVGVATLIAEFTYGWIDIATYEAGIYLAIGGLTTTIDLENYRYVLDLVAEGGANSVDNLQVKALEVEMSMDMAEGGADMNFWLKA